MNYVAAETVSIDTQTEAGHGSARLLFLDCPFNDVTGDYEDDFLVFGLKDEFGARVDETSWVDLRSCGDQIGVVSTSLVRFDATKRQAVGAEVFARLA